MPTNLIYIQNIGGKREIIDDREGAKPEKRKGYRDMHWRSETERKKKKGIERERRREKDTVTVDLVV